jgi:lysophospholipase L1-like esterase
VNVLFLGDSITDHWGKEGRSIWNEQFAPLRAANFGLDGDRTQHLLWRLEHGTTDGLNPAVVVLLIGTNNTGFERGSGRPRNTTEETVEGIARVVTVLRAKLPRSRLLLLALFPRGEPHSPERLQGIAVNQRIAALHDGEAVHFLDIGNHFLDPDQAIPRHLMPDLLHLSPAGYAVWAAAVRPPILQLMSKTVSERDPSAHTTLVRALQQSTGWIKVHAAEALLGVGLADAVRDEYRDAASRDLGACRVLALLDPRQRERYATPIVERVRKDDPELLTAIECLCKLGVPLQGDRLQLLRELEQELSAADRLLALWGLAVAQDPGALARVRDNLRSTVPVARRRAGYVLRWLKPTQPDVRSALAQAAAAEAKGTDIEVYLLSAALELGVDSHRAEEWRMRLLERVLDESAPVHVRFEACHALAGRVSPPERLRLRPLLDSAEADVRIGAARVLLDAAGSLRNP